MTKIISGQDCGNSPENLFVKKLTVAFAKGDAKFILKSVTNDIYGSRVGENLVQGKDAFAEALERMKTEPAIELTIQHVIAHGKAGAVNGTTKLKNGKTRAFCHVYEFSNAQSTSVQAIISYVIEIT